MESVYAKSCPADAIRGYIEKLIDSQKECIQKQIPIPEEFLIPEDIVLSPQNIEFLLNSKLVSFYGVVPAGNEIHFYWKTTETLPALEVRVMQNLTGVCYLTYIKEDSCDGIEEFVWDKNDSNGKKGLITISKKSDALEDICEMDYKTK